MRLIKLIVILSLGLFFFAALVVLHLGISVLRLPNRWKIVSRWMRGLTWSMRRILNIRITVEGDAGQLQHGGYVIISHHFGYLDGIVLGSLFPVIFVSKNEVKNWPIIGWWTTLCGTVFIDRQRKGLIPLAVNEISRKLKQGANILLFPEGAATNGDRILPFQTAPLAAPLRSRAIIGPISLAYQSVNKQPVSAANRDLIYCYDNMPDAPHFWKLLTLRRIEARVTIQPMIDCSRYEDNSAGRKKLAEDCYNRVLGRVSERDYAQEDEECSSANSSSPAMYQG
jgi:1-acyl-sn-glycerol-3-phosphate acyltransferase